MKQKITMKKSKNLSIREAYELFERKARVRNLSEATLKTYGYHMDSFCAFTDGEQPVKNINEDMLDAFTLYLKDERKIKDVTVNSYLRTMRNFLHFCIECCYVKNFKISVPKYDKRIKETYSDAELNRLLAKPDLKTCGFTTYKTWVFINYLLGTGNRISSALNIKIADIDFQSASIIIRKTKNRKQQIIPLSRTLADILIEYMDVRGGEADDYLFCGIYGTQGDRRTYQQLVQDYNLQRNVSKSSCHLFRHTFAKKWIMAGGDVFRLQKILGHSDLTITREYVQMFGQDLQMDFEQFNPLDRMNQKKERIRML